MSLNPADLRVSVLREVPDDPVLREQWNALVLEMHRPEIFYTQEWARAVQLAYAESLFPLLVLAHKPDGHLAGVAAMSAPRGLPVSFLCATTGDYCDFVVAPPDAARFAEITMKTLREMGCDDFVLTNLPEDSPTFAALRHAAQLETLRVYARTGYICTQVNIADSIDAEGKLELPRQKMVRRSIRAMSGSEGLHVRLETLWDKVEPELPGFFASHVARFLFTGRISNLVRPERRKFLEELARLLSPTGWLCFTRMHSGTRTTAWNYGFRFRASWFWYQPTFVNDLEKYSPGLVLLSKLIEEAAKESGAVVDLGLGAEAYKEAFANASRRTMYVTLHRSWWKHCWEFARYQVARIITKWRWAEQTARRLRTKANALRGRMKRTGTRLTLAWLWARLGRWIFSRDKVFFFEAPSAFGDAAKSSDGFELRPLSYEFLAESAMQSYDDEETLQYLIRAAKRLREKSAEGFVLVDAQGKPLHFAWATAFDGFFLAELNAKVEAPAADCVMLFDCWTPAAGRGHGYYGETVRRVGRLVRERGQKPWIFSAAQNVASMRGLEKAGFEQRYSLARRRVVGWDSVEGTTPKLDRETRAEVPARISAAR